MAINTSGRLQGTIRDGTGATTSTNDGATITDNAWHHVVVTFSRSGNMTRYVDKVATGTADSISSRATSLSGSNVFHIGSNDAATPAQFLTGQVDDARIYPYVLPSSFITRLYNDGSAQRFGPATGSP